jgi:Fic family protein
MIAYTLPDNWIRYDWALIAHPLTTAKAAVIALTSIPYQRSWAEKLQCVQLKREVAGTSRIEGADFTESELDAAMAESPEELYTRSQRQAAATVKAYRWIASLPEDQPITGDLILSLHRLIITGADDDHCPPGVLRQQDQNVTFGAPRHRGANGGGECEEAFNGLCQAVVREYQEHDALIQALAFHYHFAAMHPFIDGNGRTARALEALMLQRCGLRDSLFIAMSNYYYEEKADYLKSLAEVRAKQHDLTPFLVFGLKGIELQCGRLLDEIKTNVKKALFRNTMYDLFRRLQTPKRRVIVKRQLGILKILLESDITLTELSKRTYVDYQGLAKPYRALIRDINRLIQLGAVGFKSLDGNGYRLFVNLDWPIEITESEFFKRVKEMPKAKTYRFL